MPIPVTVDVDAAMKAKLAQYLDHLEASVRQGGDFVAEQAPEVVNQMVAYNMGMAIAAVALGATLFGVAIWSTREAVKHSERWGSTKESDFFWCMMTIVSMAAGYTGGIILVLANFSTLLKCWLAPKYFVLEQIIGLVK